MAQQTAREVEQPCGRLVELRAPHRPKRQRRTPHAGGHLKGAGVLLLLHAFKVEPHGAVQAALSVQAETFGAGGAGRARLCRRCGSDVRN